MKKYTFPVFGRLWKLESWDGEIDIELTDDEAKRLEDAANNAPDLEFSDNKDVSDLYGMVRKAFFEFNKQNMINSGALDELKKDYKDDHIDNWKDKYDKDEDIDEETICEENMPSDDELLDEEMGSWNVFYPFEFREL